MNEWRAVIFIMSQRIMGKQQQNEPYYLRKSKQKYHIDCFCIPRNNK